MELYEYPLDYEVIQPGSYTDPTVPKGQPPYQYASVPIDFEMPDTEYEVLEDLFIPEEDEDLYQQYQHENYNTIDLLIAESLQLTGNFDYDTTDVGQEGCWWFFCRPPKWTPSGQIFRWDDFWSGEVFNLPVALEGVTVRARRWFTTKKDITDRWGSFRTGQFRGPVNYSIIWKRGYFKIKTSSGLFTATLNGPRKTGSWVVNIGSGDQEYFSCIHNAAHHYYYRDIRGLRRPPMPWFPISIKAKNSCCGGLHGAWKRYIPFLPRLTIERRNDLHQRIYGTTIHEIAHASHWGMNGAYDFFMTNTNVKETWARGVQWELTRMFYPNYGGGGIWLPDYTPLVIDLIDPRDEEPIANDGDEIDGVEGYSIRQIEDALRDQRTGIQWQNNLILMFNNNTEQNVPQLYQRWGIQ